MAACTDVIGEAGQNDPDRLEEAYTGYSEAQTEFNDACSRIWFRCCSSRAKVERLDRATDLFHRTRSELDWLCLEASRAQNRFQFEIGEYGVTRRNKTANEITAYGIIE